MHIQEAFPSSCFHVLVFDVYLIVRPARGKTDELQPGQHHADQYVLGGWGLGEAVICPHLQEMTPRFCAAAHV